MSMANLTRRTWSLFESVGGWRTVAEGIVSRLLFLVAYLVTGEVVAAALVAVGGVAVFAVSRVWTDRKYWQASIGLVIVGGSALFAGTTGNAVDFYLSTVLGHIVVGSVLLVSVLLRWPIVGLVVGAARREGTSWRRDRPLLRSYQLCTGVLIVKYITVIAVMVPLYLTNQVIAIGIASVTVAGSPATALCFYLCWRILHRRTTPATNQLEGAP
ncbi:DUF3159 domain-containing protein [Kribbella hippodromi]|uniref:DUF3159 domain-containing protein n=1 Tax=Kribbella hippodromi TaxID=434347 RepID=A0ABN2ED18_9ACTN